MMDSVRVVGQPQVTDTIPTKAAPAAAKPAETAKPAIASDSVAIAKKAGGVPAVSLLFEAPAQEEPNKKAGVTFKNMMKAAEGAAKKGFTEQAIPLYDRAVALADDPGDLCKIIKSADDQAYMPVVKRALSKGLTMANKGDELQDLAKSADSRGLRPEAEALVGKAVSVTGNAKDLRKLADFASKLNMQVHAQAAYSKIAELPAGK
jgi:tetratricopeptide (TPR) repeat protein